MYSAMFTKSLMSLEQHTIRNQRSSSTHVRCSHLPRLCAYIALSFISGPWRWILPHEFD